MHDLLNQINSLSAAEKAELLDALWKSLETDAASLPDAQRAELDHRIAQHEMNRHDATAWWRAAPHECGSTGLPRGLTKNARANRIAI